MMGDAAWRCQRCQRSGAARLDAAPWPGERGRQIVAAICGDCWREWLSVQTRVINEYRLNVLDRGHARALREQMEIFLGLATPEAGTSPD